MAAGGVAAGSITGAVGALLLIVIFRNFADGTLPDWFAAKFLNRRAGQVIPAGFSAALAASVASGAAAAGVTPTQFADMGNSGSFSADMLARLAMGVGVTGERAVIAVAVALAESGGRPNAVSATNDVGLWQINMPSHPQYTKADLLSPVGNAKAMAAVSGGGANWAPWVTFQKGAHVKFMAQARTAVESI